MASRRARGGASVDADCRWRVCQPVLVCSVRALHRRRVYMLCHSGLAAFVSRQACLAQAAWRLLLPCPATAVPPAAEREPAPEHGGGRERLQQPRSAPCSVMCECDAGFGVLCSVAYSIHSTPPHEVAVSACQDTEHIPWQRKRVGEISCLSSPF